jgi:UTP--glucose-1-phosphate uridylyltransferase
MSGKIYYFALNGKKMPIKNNITKAVIPAAGLGTRFLPITKSIPKEMLPLLNKPAIQYIIEEGLAARITDFYIITSSEKQALEHYLTPSPELAAQLKKNKKENLMIELQKLLATTKYTYIEQAQPLGLGHAIAMAHGAIGNEYFAVFLPDDIVFNTIPAIEQLALCARNEKATVIAVQEVERDYISAYGSIAIKKKIQDGLVEVDHIIEKPHPDDAPSNLAVIGRYILSPRIFDAIDAITPTDRTHAKREIQLTDALTKLVENKERVLALTLQGTRFDLGSPPGWLQANIYLGLQDPAVAPQLRAMVK